MCTTPCVFGCDLVYSGITFFGILMLLRVFFETFLQTPENTLFEIFLRFRARRARRLLQMAARVARLATLSACWRGDFGPARIKGFGFGLPLIIGTLGVNAFWRLFLCWVHCKGNLMTFLKRSIAIRADPGVLWKHAPRALRAMRGKTLETVPFQPYFGCTKSFLKVLSN